MGQEMSDQDLRDQLHSATQALEQVKEMLLGAFICDCADTAHRNCPRCKWLWEFDKLASARSSVITPEIKS